MGPARFHPNIASLWQGTPLHMGAFSDTRRLCWQSLKHQDPLSSSSPHCKASGVKAAFKLDHSGTLALKLQSERSLHGQRCPYQQCSCRDLSATSKLKLRLNTPTEWVQAMTCPTGVLAMAKHFNVVLLARVL